MGDERKEFEMTQEQLNRLLEASKPVPYMVFGGVEPRSPQEYVNNVWGNLAEEMGFDQWSVRPVTGKDQRFFSAFPKEKQS